MAYSPYQTHVSPPEPYRIPSGVFFTDFCPEVPLDCSPATIFPIFPNARPAVNPGVAPPADKFPRSSSQSKPQQVLCLPLLDVAIDVRVDSTIATTRFMQRFKNISNIAIPEAHYTFPIYDGAAVTTFRYYIGDSEVLIGKVLSNEEAMNEYMRAIESMEAAALLEEKTPEVFQTMIGNIPPKTSVKIEITYVSELKSDIGGQGYLVTIPTSLAPRYGTPPAGYSSSSAMDHTGLAVVVAVNSHQPICQIECRSHLVSVDMGSAGAPPDLLDFDVFYAQASSGREGGSAALNPRQATVRLSDPNAGMHKDFVVFIKTSRDDDSATRSQALLSPANEHGHSALMVTIQPSELFSTHKPQVDFRGEIVFIADRSGSMGGEKISGLRDALHVFVKSLPDTCTFNLYSFGTSFQSLWQSSMPYSQETLDEAVSHISGFSADMGGTELLPALENAVIRRSTTGHSTQIIVLTDGQVWNANKTINFVQHTRSELGDGFRLFVLGIGDTVSHRLIEGVSGAGGGFGEVVGIATPDKWQNRVIRMLKGALMPPTWNCEIDLGPQFIRLDLNEDSFPWDKKNDKRNASNSWEYIRAPQSPSIHHFKQSSIFCLLNTGSTAPLSSVTITATAGANRGDVIKATLPVLSIATPDRTLQHLAVKSALVDLDIRADQQQPHDAADDSVASRNAVLLGKLYSVTSRWTSFVATNGDGSVAHPIDSYDALAGDLHLLAAPKPYTTPFRSLLSELRPGQSTVASTPRSAHAGLLQSVSAMMSNECPSENYSSGMPRNGSGSGFKSPIFEFCHPSLGYATSQGIRAEVPSAKRSIDVADIVDSQTASGRFRISSGFRERLTSNLPAGTREAIQANMREQNDEHGSEAVDTLMMTKYIETKLDDKKDLLELVVDKAVRSVKVARSEGHQGANSSAKMMARESNCNADEPESEEEEG